jgi:nitrate reductase NapA
VNKTTAGERKSLKIDGIWSEKGPYTIDNQDLLIQARDMGLTPDLPDKEYPMWLGLGVVYEHFHTAKTIRAPTTRKLVPEQYVELHVK